MVAYKVCVGVGVYIQVRAWRFQRSTWDAVPQAPFGLFWNRISDHTRARGSVWTGWSASSSKAPTYLCLPSTGHATTPFGWGRLRSGSMLVKQAHDCVSRLPNLYHVWNTKKNYYLHYLFFIFFSYKINEIFEI